MTARLATLRNEFVAALALVDEIVFAHTTPGGHTDRLRAQVAAQGKVVLPKIMAMPDAV